MKNSDLQTIAFQKSAVYEQIACLRAAIDQAHASEFLENSGQTKAIQNSIVALETVICIVEYTMSCFEKDEIIIDTTQENLLNLESMVSEGKTSEDFLSLRFLDALKKSLLQNLPDVSPQTQNLLQDYFSDWCDFLEGIILQKLEKTKAFTDRLLNFSEAEISIQTAEDLKTLKNKASESGEERLGRFYSENHSKLNELLKNFEEIVDQDFLLKSKEDSLDQIFEGIEENEPEELRKKMNLLKTTLEGINETRSQSFNRRKTIYKQILDIISSNEIFYKN